MEKARVDKGGDQRSSPICKVEELGRERWPYLCTPSCTGPTKRQLPSCCGTPSHTSTCMIKRLVRTRALERQSRADLLAPVLDPGEPEALVLADLDARCDRARRSQIDRVASEGSGGSVLSAALCFPAGRQASEQSGVGEDRVGVASAAGGRRIALT